jgi:large subunit ribosomal protein L3
MGRLYKGRHAPGKMGNHNVQVRNLTVLEVDMEKNKMLISGMIPGSSLTLSRIEIVK